MDDFGGGQSVTFDLPKQDEEAGSSFAVGLFHILALLFCCCCCCRCCCRRPKSQQQAQGQQGQQGQTPQRPGASRENPIRIGPEHIAVKRRLSTCYVLWLVCGPLANAHHFYLGRAVHGLVCVWTLNFLGIGWLCDAVLMPAYVRQQNDICTDPSTGYDKSIWRLARLPVVFVLLLILGLVAGTSGPYWLDRVGAVDLDRLHAQTELNPYDTLEIPRGADLVKVKSAYRSVSLRWHPDRNMGCGRPCELKMSEITKAFMTIKKRRAPTVHETWREVFEEIGNDWYLIAASFIQKNKDEGDNVTEVPKAEL